MKIIDVAVSQLGVEETQLNEIKYNTWYYDRKVSGGSYPYCAVFLSWCAWQAKLDMKIFPKTASVKTLQDFFIKANRFHSGNNYIPTIGDIMIQRNKASHTGIVESVETNGFWVIEGVSGRGIVRTFYNYTDPTITGYGTPEYPQEIVKSFKSTSKLQSNSLSATNNTNGNTSTTGEVAGGDVSSTSNTNGNTGTTGETTSGAVVSTAPATTNLKVRMSEEEIWDWFRFRGYDESATAGIMGRLVNETSGYDPSWKALTIKNGYESGGMGIFNWTWDRENTNEDPISDLETGRKSFPQSRCAQYLAWCDANGIKYESTGAQLEYAWSQDFSNQQWAANNVGISSWFPDGLNSRKPEEVATLWTSGYERKQASNETANAQKIYNKYKGRAIPTTNPSGGTTSNSSSSVVAGTTSSSTSLRSGNINFQETAGRYKYVQHTVLEGETLESIAKQHNITPQMIFFANNLEKWEVIVGQVLQIPQATIERLTPAQQIEGVEELENLTHTKSITVSHPTVEIDFYGEYGKLSVTSTLNPTSKEHFEQDIIAVMTKRDMSQDCPTFIIQLIWRNDWYRKLSSNDMLMIKMWRPPEEKHVVFYGLIDDIRKTTDWSNLQPKRILQVTGRGFNKAFCHFDIGIIENYSGLYKEGGFFLGLRDIVSKSSSEAISITLDNYIDKGLKYKFGNGKSLSDYTYKDFTPYPGEVIFDIQSFTTFYGTMWNFIKQLSNQPWNETYWEIVGDELHLIHRPTPFVKDRWINIKRTLIKDDELVSDNTGRSDLETYTVFQCNSSFLQEYGKNIYYPVWYPPFYPKYGLREMKRDTIYQVSSSGYNSRVFTIDLFNFNIKNNVSENGQIVVKGSNKYKVGERVILESSGMEYYVEAVSHSFTVYESWTTILSVTRGLRPSERFTPPYGVPEDLTPSIMGQLIALTRDGKIDWSKVAEQSYAQLSGKNGQRSNGSGVSSADALYDFQGINFIFPIEGWTYEDAVNDDRITSPFGYRTHPVYGTSRFHSGIDLGFDLGTHIVSSADGIVESAGAAGGYGNYILINHGNGISTGYAHMYDDGIFVKSGDKVKAGQHIADVGSSGTSTGAHLHFEVLINGEVVDPVTAFTARKNVEYTNVTYDSAKKEIIKAVYDYATSQLGLSKAGACALLGNIQQISDFRLDEDSSGNIGLFRWKGNKKTNLIAFCNKNGLNILTVAGQMGFLHEEFKHEEAPSFDTLQIATDSVNGVYNAAIQFGKMYEKFYLEGERGKYAVNFYKTL